MKKNVSFSKTITFRTMIAEIADISVNHTLKLKENDEISGDILVDGKYKMTEASSLLEEFHYKLPFVIAVDSKYNTEDIIITIDDFNFEIINEEDLKINVEIGLDCLYERELVRNDIEEIPVEVDEEVEKVELKEMDMEPIEKLEKELESDKEESKSIESIFSSLESTEETYSTYYVYIVREMDTLEKIIDKYKITKEELSNYNDIDDIKIGTKLIIPCHNE